MYRIAVFLFAAEWLALAFVSSYVLALAVWGAISGEKVRMDPFWPSVLPPIALILAVPLFLVYRRSRISSLELDSEFKRCTSLLQFLGMLLIVTGLFVCACMLVLPLVPLGLTALAAPVWFLGIAVSLLALGTGLFLVEALYVFWPKKRRSNKAMQPTCEDARG